VVALLDSLTVAPPEPSPADWNGEGVVILENRIDQDLITSYQRAWRQSNGYRSAIQTESGAWMLDADRPGGWPDCTPYMRHPEILDLVAPLESVLEGLIGEPGGLNLNLTGWVTTQRDWHQDSYLNEPEVGDHYAAVWIALGDIHPDSGPFQYVPGSHRWPQVTRERIGRHVNLGDPGWPKHSEKVLSPMFAELIDESGAQVVTHLPKSGDVLIWHGRLLHRGTIANLPGAYRPAFIGHFSGINHRSSMPRALRWNNGGWFFPIASSGPVMA
jgi:ectoine hydroxylase-related dioxygenase (phytanoyl-CoA dioxygenase family)